MEYSSWEPTYLEICKQFGYSVEEDSAAVRVLEQVTMNSDLCDEDVLTPILNNTVTVFGNQDTLEKDLQQKKPEGTLIAAGQSCSKLKNLGIVPDILVTDLDGEIESQIEFSNKGTVTLIHAHGDNKDLIMRYAPEFKGKVILTCQGKPRGNVLCFGGFTDGDRQVCLARHFGVRRIILIGFDFDNPSESEENEKEIKRKKLHWAKKIISPDSKDVVWQKSR